MKRNIRSGSLAALAAASLLLILTGQTGKAAGVEGFWEGAIVTRPGVLEMDLILEFRPGEGASGGYLYTPTRSLEPQPLKSLSIDKRTVSFVYEDDTGESQFTGLISEDGTRISGDLIEQGRRFSFFLDRLPGKPLTKAPPVVQLEGQGTELKEAFNQGRGAVRVIAVLSPSCHMCKIGARLVRRHLLQAIEEDDLRVYLVWEDILDSDSQEAALQSALLVEDPRAAHFWSGDRVIGKLFQQHAEFAQEPVWDVFMAFSPEAAWSDQPPAPDYLMHNNKDYPQELRLDALNLAKKVRALSEQ